MNRILTATLLLAAAAAALPPVVSGQIPPGYWIQQITDNSFQEGPPRLNSRGEIVFERRSGPGGTGELFLYDRESETLTQLTDDAVVDAFPDISEDGTITWTSFIGPPGEFGPTGEIMIRDPDGTVTRITDNDLNDLGSRINSLHHLAWTREMGPGCGGATMDIYFFDGDSVRPITTDGVPLGVANQGAALSDDDRLVWTRYDFCPNPWESEILFFDSGDVSRISPVGTIQPQLPTINTAGTVGWTAHMNGTNGIELWENGVTSVLTEWGRNPIINDVGQLYFIRWHNDSSTWQAWLYRDSSFLQLSADPFWNTAGDINIAGECAWRSGPTFTSDIRYLRRFALGDMNCDASVNAFDIEGLILALFDPVAYVSAYPECDIELADLNQDGAVDAFDIEPFIQLLFP